jgi:membrane-anchored protein YejM (alkaline phosphatase superfamily)
MVERGVRFVELTIPMVDGYSRWDAHGGLVKNHGDNARAVDQPIAGLLMDLKQRGLLDETLVIYRSGQEFVNEGLLPKYLVRRLV